MASYISPALTFTHTIPWLRRILPPTVPLVLKGIQTAADAVRAMHAGADGILLSNHGGRSLDTSPATVLVLLELQRCCPEVFERMEVFVDGGVMRGADVFKGLCLGARGLGVGRGVLYGMCTSFSFPFPLVCSRVCLSLPGGGLGCSNQRKAADNSATGLGYGREGVKRVVESKFFLPVSYIYTQTTN
jgi:hypothetical protein